MVRQVPIERYGACGRLFGSSDRKVKSGLSGSCRFRWSVRLEARPSLHRAWSLSAVAGGVGAPIGEARCLWVSRDFGRTARCSGYCTASAGRRYSVVCGRAAVCAGRLFQTLLR